MKEVKWKQGIDGMNRTMNTNSNEIPDPPSHVSGMIHIFRIENEGARCLESWSHGCTKGMEKNLFSSKVRRTVQTATMRSWKPCKLSDLILTRETSIFWKRSGFWSVRIRWIPVLHTKEMSEAIICKNNFSTLFRWSNFTWPLQSRCKKLSFAVLKSNFICTEFPFVFRVDLYTQMRIKYCFGVRFRDITSWESNNISTFGGFLDLRSVIHANSRVSFELWDLNNRSWQS